ncbi:hypothetical protein [Dickeya ananatis]
MNGVSGVYSRVIKHTEKLSVADIGRTLQQFKQEDAATSEHYKKNSFYSAFADVARRFAAAFGHVVAKTAGGDLGELYRDIAGEKRP